MRLCQLWVFPFFRGDADTWREGTGILVFGTDLGFDALGDWTTEDPRRHIDAKSLDCG